MKRLAFAIAVAGCSSSAPAEKPPQPQAVAPAVAPAPGPVKPEPAAAGGAEVLVTDQPWATDLVVTDDELYWISGQFETADIFRAPHRRSATAERLYDSTGASELIAIGDKLAWQQDAFSIYTMPRHGGAAAKLVDLPDAASFLVDHGGLVVGAYMPDDKAGARVLRVSDRGEVTEIIKLPKMVTPRIAFTPNDAMIVATHADGWTSKVAVVGTLVDGKLVAFPEPKGALAIAVDGDVVYCLLTDGIDSSIVKVTPGAKHALDVVKQQAGGITALAVDDNYLYWAEYVLGGDGTGGKLWRLAKAGGKPEAIADMGETSRLVIYGPDLYWADGRRNLIARIRR